MKLLLSKLLYRIGDAAWPRFPRIYSWCMTTSADLDMDNKFWKDR